MPVTGKSTNDNIPPGFTLRHTLRGHSSWISRIAWSPDGKMLSSPADDKRIRLWDAQTGKHLRTLNGHSDTVWGTAWSPNGTVLVSVSFDRTIREWDVQTGKYLGTIKGPFSDAFSIAWSPDGKA